MRLLVRALPSIAKQDALALKGGPSSNSSIATLARLSADIDLTYLPLQDRDTTLKGINDTHEAIRADLQASLKGVKVTRIAGGDNGDTRVLVRDGLAGVKVRRRRSPAAPCILQGPWW